MDRSKAFHYRDRGESFLNLMKVGADPEIVEQWLERQLIEFEDGTALLAVHAAIAFGDAALVYLTGERSTAQNHPEAAEKLQRACARAKLDSKGISHLRWLTSHKDDIAYGDHRVSSDTVKSAMVHAERFAAWLYETLPALGEETS